MYSNFAGDDRVSQYMSWDSFKTVEDVEKCIDEWQEEYKKDDTYYWGISHPLLTKEFLYSWFDGFKNFDVNKLENRKMLIDPLVKYIGSKIYLLIFKKLSLRISLRGIAVKIAAIGKAQKAALPRKVFATFRITELP